MQAVQKRMQNKSSLLSQIEERKQLAEQQAHHRKTQEQALLSKAQAEIELDTQKQKAKRETLVLQKEIVDQSIKEAQALKEQHKNQKRKEEQAELQALRMKMVADSLQQQVKKEQAKQRAATMMEANEHQKTLHQDRLLKEAEHEQKLL